MDGKPNYLLKCHIQDIDTKSGSCIVFIEKLSEKRSVAIDQIQMFKANESPRHYNRWYDKGYLDARENEKRSDNFKSYTDRMRSRASDYDDITSDAISKSCDLEPYTNLMNFQPTRPFQLIALPVEFKPAPPQTNMSANNSGNPPKTRILGAPGPMVVVTPASQCKGTQAGPMPVIADENYSSKHGEMKVSPKHPPGTKLPVAPPHSQPAQTQSAQAPPTTQQPAGQAVPEYPQQAHQETVVDPGVQGTPQGYMYVHANPSMYTYPQTVQSEYGEQMLYGYPSDVGYYAVAQNGVYQTTGSTAPQSYASVASPSSMYQVQMPVNAWSSYGSPMNQGS